MAPVSGKTQEANVGKGSILNQHLPMLSGEVRCAVNKILFKIKF